MFSNTFTLPYILNLWYHTNSTSRNNIYVPNNIQTFRRNIRNVCILAAKLSLLRLAQIIYIYIYIYIYAFYVVFQSHVFKCMRTVSTAETCSLCWKDEKNSLCLVTAVVPTLLQHTTAGWTLYKQLSHKQTNEQTTIFVKLSLWLIKHEVMRGCRVGGNSPGILISTSDWSESASGSSRFTPR